MKVPEQKPVEVIMPDSVAVTEGEEQVYLEKPSEFTPVTDLHGVLTGVSFSCSTSMKYNKN